MVDLDADEGEDVNYNPEDEVVGNWQAINLPEIPTITGRISSHLTLSLFNLR